MLKLPEAYFISDDTYTVDFRAGTYPNRWYYSPLQLLTCTPRLAPHRNDRRHDVVRNLALPETGTVGYEWLTQDNSFIHQPSSWSHLQISADTVKQLLTAHTVSPAFLDALYSFGAKVTGDDDPYFNLWFHQVHSSGQDKDASLGKLAGF